MYVARGLGHGLQFFSGAALAILWSKTQFVRGKITLKDTLKV